MPIQRRIDSLRHELLDKLDEWRALLFLLGSLNEARLSELEFGIDKAKTENRKWVEGSLATVTVTIRDTRREFGVTIPAQELLTLQKRALFNASNEQAVSPEYGPTYIYFAKLHLQKWVSNYHLIVPAFADLPVHARIGIPSPPQHGDCETFLLEAIHFEQMAMLFNECAVLSSGSWTGRKSPLQLKRLRTLLHSCHIAVFHFLEAYLNGIAFDFANRNAGWVDQRDFEMLFEWNFEKDREKHVAFRDKLIQYPRIILRREHPPFTESSSEAHKIVLEESKALRDAITHSSPRPLLKSYRGNVSENSIRIADLLEQQAKRKSSKEDHIMATDFTSLQRTVDASIKVVLMIEDLCGGYMKKLGYVQERDENGLFSEELFL